MMGWPMTQKESQKNMLPYKGNLLWKASLTEMSGIWATMAKNIHPVIFLMAIIVTASWMMPLNMKQAALLKGLLKPFLMSGA